jgi:hypothetical protein
MTRHILGLRLSRRAIGAVALSGDGLTLVDGRHLTSMRDRAVEAAIRYINQLLLQSRAAAVIVEAPAVADRTSVRRLADAIAEVVAAKGLPVILVTKRDVAVAFGLPPTPTREQIRDIARAFWPQLLKVVGTVRPYVVDAAAAVLVGECRMALNPRPT